MFIDPTTFDFKAYFDRDFPYGTTQETVMDSDILKGLQDAKITINQGLFGSQPAYQVGFLNLAAHFMVLSLKASSGGLQGQASWLQTSRAVGSVSESITVPQRILDNPEFAALSKTGYGMKYLLMILPLLSGQIFTVRGGTRA